MRGDPQHLWRGEAGHGEIAGARFEIGDAPFELGAFGKRPAVVPQNRGSERFVLRVEQRRAMHMARKTDARQRREVGRGMAADCGDCGLDSLDPIGRVLLAPQGMRARNAERDRSFGEHALVEIDKQRLHRGRTDVEAQKRLSCLPSHRRLPLEEATINKKPRPCRRGSGSSASDYENQATFRFPADERPVRLSATISKATFCPSLSSLSPARSTALIWTNTSLPPSSGWMKPKPFVALNHLTVPIAIDAVP